MPRIIPIRELKNTNGISEKQFDEGKSKDARTSLSDLRAKYGL